jgi:histidine triad (HIT) family protein
VHVEKDPAVGIGESMKKKQPEEKPTAECLFCEIAAHRVAAKIVFEDAISVAFLDHRPLFPGHVLLIPKEHYRTLTDLPSELVGPFFRNAQHLTTAVESAMKAEGSFVAMNNVVSQSVPHFHVHIVPRTKGDGLRGFFWPRLKPGEDELVAVHDSLANRSKK